MFEIFVLENDLNGELLIRLVSYKICINGSFSGGLSDLQTASLFTSVRSEHVIVVMAVVNRHGFNWFFVSLSIKL